MVYSKIAFSIDRGGTFTDIYARSSVGRVYVMKLLSVNPDHYNDAPTEGIRRILEREFQISIPIGEPIDSNMIESIRMGTTVATNALLERKGEPFALLVTEGFKDILYIGNQSRPAIFDLKIQTPEMLYQEVVEVEERVILKQDNCGIEDYKSCEVQRGVTGEDVIILKKINMEKLTADLQSIRAKGIESVAIALLHSFNYPEHEKQVASLAKSLGFKYITLSSDVMPMIKVVSRGFTACADAYLTPHIQRYIAGFSKGFKDQLKDSNILFMQSDGGLTSVSRFTGARAILSGPAGGVVGYAYTTKQDLESDLPVIGFDMGGTSTDVSRFDKTFEHTYESTTAGITIQAPQLDITTVAAGGGSKLVFRSGLYVVGPESTGAYPGPVCYRNGGELAVTDANLCLGRLLPQYFPKIFGPQKNQALDKESTLRAFQTLSHEINNASQGKAPSSIEDVALGFIKVANEAMCRPIRSITQGKGYDTSRHVLACFGGAGGQHACAVARDLGIETVYVHRYSSILSAYGMALADVVNEAQEPASLEYSYGNFCLINDRLNALKAKSKDVLVRQGIEEDCIEFEYYLNMRYAKTDFAVMTQSEFNSKLLDDDYCNKGEFDKSFSTRYEREFGFTLPDRTILIDDIRVRAIGKTKIDAGFVLEPSTTSSPPPPSEVVDCYFEVTGYAKTSVYHLGNLLPNHVLRGPCMIIDDNNTVLIEPDCVATITKAGNIKINIEKPQKGRLDTTVDPIQLSIFSHRFMSIAEEMGKVLQRTAISTNIKERLDFSCALFGPDGGLVSNAPHIPVHLGAMQEAVQFQLKSLGKSISRGDVILSNHPCAGGSHLPDITVITPVFFENHESPVFFVASRGHHADIGGITPGSMPPHSTLLSQEGATFVSFKIVEKGVFQEAALIELFMAPKNFEGSSGSRTLSDNISDLKAQIAANHKGIKLVTELIQYYGLDVVQSYMHYIQENAELAVKDMLCAIAKNLASSDLYAEDFMDDGTVIKLHVSIDKENGTSVFDFEGTGIEVHGNCNTPKAVTLSAIIYCLRCMVGYDIPLNQGCLKPIKVNIPRNSILWPSDEAAVVGGNVLTSQRVVDVVLKAFQVCAASQGCMNNVTFGDDNLGYYETVAGGAGAGPNWPGRSGVHTHMTNTRITDVEVIEKRYPILVQKFRLNPHTGGAGMFSGGDGVLREIMFRKNLVLSVLTERRVFSPYGLHGGKEGSKGLNILKFRSGRTVNLGSKSSVNVAPGDVFHLETPGGGGYGVKN